MSERIFRGGLQLAAVVAALLWFENFGHAAGSSRAEETGNCDQAVPAITSGYGADGPYVMDQQDVRNPAFGRQPVHVFLPKDADGKRPVIFFSHGYGPNRWDGYADLIRHIVSRGNILVYATYPALFANMDQRYDSLWRGFESAVDRFGARMDLSRVGFLGHSFGGGATPEMAFRGFVEKGWGKRGAFMMELAPWYMYQMTAAQWRRLPDSVLQVVEVYDRDKTNDHRMAIDIYNKSPMAGKFFFITRTLTANGCELLADHSTPGRSQWLRLKQYAVFRPFDALADAAFKDSAAARDILASMGNPDKKGNYQPLKLETQPVPAEPESFYKFPWSSAKNPQFKR